MPLEMDPMRLVKSRAVDRFVFSAVDVLFMAALFANVMSKCSSMGVIFCSESRVWVLFDELMLFSVGVVDAAKAFRAMISSSVHLFVISLAIYRTESINIAFLLRNTTNLPVKPYLWHGSLCEFCWYTLPP